MGCPKCHYEYCACCLGSYTSYRHADAFMTFTCPLKFFLMYGSLIMCLCLLTGKYVGPYSAPPIIYELLRVLGCLPICFGMFLAVVIS